MKFTVLLIILTIFISCNVSNNHTSFQNSHSIIAVNQGNNYTFKIDTLSFKKRISKAIFSKESNVQYNKINIVKQKSINSDDSFFLLILYCKEKNLKTAKLLKLNNNYLIIDNKNSFEKTFISCVGGKDCFPNIFKKKDNSFGWSCSSNISECFIDDNGKCKSFKSILIEE